MEEMRCGFCDSLDLKVFQLGNGYFYLRCGWCEKPMSQKAPYWQVPEDDKDKITLEQKLSWEIKRRGTN